jgi:membrane-bound metal-dependent hydrolase YbcI (DUF457 family)
MDGKTHRAVGAGSGFAVAFVRADGQETWKQIAEGGGGALGGYFGAGLPDVLEPAIHSWHRNGCHSVAAGTGVVLGARKAISDWERKCRELANGYEAKGRASGSGEFQKLLCLLAEIILRVAAGLLSGAATGYASHLLLDLVTPRGIPLICRQLV